MSLWVILDLFFNMRNSLVCFLTFNDLTLVDIWERNKELIRKRTDIGEHFTRDVI
jgi:hypothetical protein